MNTENYEFYRASSVGAALLETLDDLISANRMPSALAIKMLHNFDRVVPEVLSTELNATTTIKGKINHYKQVDNVWKFVLKNATFMTKENGQRRDEVHELTAENLTVLACPVKRKSS